MENFIDWLGYFILKVMSLLLNCLIVGGCGLFFWGLFVENVEILVVFNIILFDLLGVLFYVVFLK